MIVRFPDKIFCSLPKNGNGQYRNMSRLIFVVFLFISVFAFWVGLPTLSAQVDPAENWSLVKEDSEAGIKVYYRLLETGNMEFKGITRIHSTLNGFIALFVDLETMPEWVYRIEKSRVLIRVSERESYSHNVHSMPLWLKKRDSVVHTYLEQDPINQSVIIRGRAAPDFIPPKKEYVRINEVVSYWKFVPEKDGRVEVTFQGYGDPGGGLMNSMYHSPIFRWLVKKYLWKLPYETMKNMKTVVTRPEYQTKNFGFIVEPTQQ